MLDIEAWTAICSILSTIDHSRRPDVQDSDAFGSLHVILFGDFKQLPPASSRAPFIRLPSFARDFEFRCLNENRRVVRESGREAEIQNFHEVLADISEGKASEKVRKFIIDAYVRGRHFTIAEEVPVEGTTTVVTRRRYRDKWNRKVVRIPFFRIASITIFMIPNSLTWIYCKPLCLMHKGSSVHKRCPPKKM